MFETGVAVKQILFLVINLSLCPLVIAGSSCCASAKRDAEYKPTQTPSPEATKLDEILNNIRKATETLETCQATISHLSIEDPELIDSRMLRTGKLYYQKEEKGAKLRIRFETLQQDDFEPEKRIEDFYFDGVWLTIVDYKLEQITLYQKAPENNPIDVFELINQHFPLIGFSKTDALQKEFDISLVKEATDDPNEPIQLLLSVKKDSKYKDEYHKIDFWIYRDDFLPARIKAYSTQGDIDDIQFLAIQPNKKLKNRVFTVENPANFSKNIQALETDSTKKGN